MNEDNNNQAQTASPETGSASQGSSHEADMRSVFAPHTVKPTVEPVQQSEPAVQTSAPAQGQAAAPQTQQTQTAPVITQQQQHLNPRELAQSIVQAQMEAQQLQQATTASQRDMSPEEFNQKYGVVQVTAQHIDQIFNAKDPGQAAAVLNQLLQGAVRQGVLMSQGLYKNDIGQFQQKFTAFEQFQQKQTHERLWSEFAKKNPDLANDRSIVEEAVAAAIGRGMKFANAEEAFGTIATNVRTTIQRLRGGGTGTAPVQGAQTSDTQRAAPTQRKMAPLLTGGRSGSAPSGPANDIQSIFGGTRNPAFAKR